MPFSFDAVPPTSTAGTEGGPKLPFSFGGSAASGSATSSDVNTATDTDTSPGRTVFVFGKSSGEKKMSTARATMASSEGDGTAAAAEQLGSISLGGSVDEGKDNDDTGEPNAKNGTTPTKMCSACGEKGDTLKKCSGCECVWYCDKKCQNKHRKEHKKECKRIKMELAKRGGKLDVGTEEFYLGPLEKLPPREECPICMHVLPIHANLRAYFACCGKTICAGCEYQHKMKTKEMARTCAFCRTTLPKSDEEVLARTRKRVELKDPDAMHALGMDYALGGHGLTVDEAKCIGLLHQAADLGSSDAQYQLANFYHNGRMGLEANEEKAFEYLVEAADCGHLVSLHNVGAAEVGKGNGVTAMRHWRLAASAGYRSSMETLIECFELGVLHHVDLAETLQAMYHARSEIKSEDRNKYVAHLKVTGQYETFLDW